MALEVTPTAPHKSTGEYKLVPYGTDDFGEVFAILDPNGELMLKTGPVTTYVPETYPPQVKQAYPAVVRTIRKRNGEQLVEQFNKELAAGKRAGKTAPAAEKG